MRYLQGQQLQHYNQNLTSHQQAYNQFLGNEGLKQNQAQLALQQFSTIEGLNQTANAQNLANQGFLSGQHQQAFNNYQSLDNNAYSRYTTDQNNQYDRLLGLVGLGQNSAAKVGASGMNTAQAVANNTMAGANSQAAGIANQANIRSDYANQLGSLASAYATSRKSGVV